MSDGNVDTAAPDVEPEAAAPAKARRRKGISPTARTLAECRKRGWVAEVVEKRLPIPGRAWANLKDLFGFIDVLALDCERRRVVGIQACRGDDVSTRIAKIAAAEHVGAVREAGIAIEVWGWRKAANGRWTLRVVDVS